MFCVVTCTLSSSSYRCVNLFIEMCVCKHGMQHHFVLKVSVYVTESADFVTTGLSGCSPAWGTCHVFRIIVGFNFDLDIVCVVLKRSQTTAL